VLKTFRLEKETINGLSTFLELHPEVGSMNHLVAVALQEFVSLHKHDKSWLKNVQTAITT
jgi:hypothetical protein